jgi:hypothetical protein
VLHGLFRVYDPTGIEGRGYIDPATGRPYPSSQPYAKNFSKALAYTVRSSNGAAISIFDPSEFQGNPGRFWEEFMSYNYPNRHANARWNSDPIRKHLKRLP